MRTIMAITLAAILAFAQITVTLPKTANPQVQTAVQQMADYVAIALLALRATMTVAFWGVVGILAFHTIMAKLMPTRFTRVGALMDAFERLRDVLYAALGLFLAIYVIAVLTSIAGGQNQDPLTTAGDVFKWLFIEPIIDAFKAFK